MVKKGDDRPEMVQLASVIEDDLQQLEQLAQTVTKLPLSTEKNLTRAARTLQDALQQQEQLAAALGSLGGAMMRMQERQQKAITLLSARAHEIQSQMTRWSEHMARFGALGKQAVEVTQLLQELPPPYGGGPAQEGNQHPNDEIAEIDQRLETLAREAKALTASADDAELHEVSREAGSLRQSIEAARTRLTQIVKSQVERTN